MKHMSLGRLTALTTMMAASTACGGGDDRPSVDAIADSLHGSEIVADLTPDEARCFAQALHDGELPTATLANLMSNDATQSDLDRFNRTAPDAAAACGFTYIRG